MPTQLSGQYVFSCPFLHIFQYLYIVGSHQVCVLAYLTACKLLIMYLLFMTHDTTLFRTEIESSAALQSGRNLCLSNYAH